MLFGGLQDAYEPTVAAGGGTGNLLFTAWKLVKTYFYPAVEAKNVYLETHPSLKVRGKNERRQPVNDFVICCNHVDPPNQVISGVCK